ncbi:hypothetical protein BIW11_06575 [Tropilaelaps mercedesae]|uniref:Uncharacterized protein n=1 Tax=Tropilaelaps mercedesae TaxID=418985 RepID=A0A1V9XXJ2_9ACAR|nr:hypothetical protein BIW11_06575 [Tropilaelaps mercedesae]
MQETSEESSGSGDLEDIIDNTEIRAYLVDEFLGSTESHSAAKPFRKLAYKYLDKYVDGPRHSESQVENNRDIVTANPLPFSPPTATEDEGDIAKKTALTALAKTENKKNAIPTGKTPNLKIPANKTIQRTNKPAPLVFKDSAKKQGMGKVNKDTSKQWRELAAILRWEPDGGHDAIKKPFNTCNVALMAGARWQDPPSTEEVNCLCAASALSDMEACVLGASSRSP